MTIRDDAHAVLADANRDLDRVRKGREAKIPCPRCGAGDSLVLPRKHSHPPDGYVRHRQCTACACIYATVESLYRVVQAKTA